MFIFCPRALISPKHIVDISTFSCKDFEHIYKGLALIKFKKHKWLDENTYFILAYNIIVKFIIKKSIIECDYS